MGGERGVKNNKRKVARLRVTVRSLQRKGPLRPHVRWDTQSTDGKGSLRGSAGRVASGKEEGGTASQQQLETQHSVARAAEAAVRMAG